jgi:hypothetical protein
MTNGSIRLGDRSYDFIVNMDQIIMQGTAYDNTLCIPINIDFVPEQKFEILSCTATLTATDKNIKVSEWTTLISTSINIATKFYFTFKFPISNTSLKLIEMHRMGNLPLNLYFSMQFGLKQVLTHQDHLGRTAQNGFITNTWVSQMHISVEIEQSYWIKKLLSNTKYQAFTLIELPSITDLVSSEYSQSLAELQEAQKYFLNIDYDKTVAHCRAAIEPLKKKLPELKKYIQSKSEFDWISEVTNATGDWLEKMIKATSSITSKTHHVPSMGHFSKKKAEIIVMATTAIIAYIAQSEFKAT